MESLAANTEDSSQTNQKANEEET